MTVEEVQWMKARAFSVCDPEHVRQDSNGMPMCRELFNRRQAGGWGINEAGDAEAFQPFGRPAMGDQQLSSVIVSWFLPSEIRWAA